VPFIEGMFYSRKYANINLHFLPIKWPNDSHEYCLITLLCLLIDYSESYSIIIYFFVGVLPMYVYPSTNFSQFFSLSNAELPAEFQRASLVARCSRTQMSRRYFPQVNLSFSGPWLTPQGLTALDYQVHIARTELNEFNAPVVNGDGTTFVVYNLSRNAADQAVVYNLDSLNALDVGHTYQLDVSLFLICYIFFN